MFSRVLRVHKNLQRCCKSNALRVFEVDTRWGEVEPKETGLIVGVTGVGARSVLTCGRLLER